MTAHDGSPTSKRTPLCSGRRRPCLIHGRISAVFNG
jgi:hypothetical protein